jgi:methyl-accepting chemotaxis protein
MSLSLREPDEGISAVRSWYRRSAGRYSTRLVVGVLVITVPIMALIVVLLSQNSTKQITEGVQAVLFDRAATLAGDVDTYLGERRSDLKYVAADISGEEQAEWDTELRRALRVDPSVQVLELVDASGTVVAIAAQPGYEPIEPGAADWFQDAVAGEETVSLLSEGGEVEIVMAQPVPDGDGQTSAVLVTSLRLTGLAPHLESAGFARTGAISLVDQDRRVILSSRTADDPDSAGALPVTADTEVLRAALGGETGAASGDYEGVRSFIGYAPVPTAGWAVVVSMDRSEVLVLVNEQRRLGLALVLLGTC